MKQEEICKLIGEDLKKQIYDTIDLKKRQAETFEDHYRNTGDKEKYNKMYGKVVALSEIRDDIGQVINNFCENLKKGK